MIGPVFMRVNARCAHHLRPPHLPVGLSCSGRPVDFSPPPNCRYQSGRTRLVTDRMHLLLAARASPLGVRISGPKRPVGKRQSSSELTAG
jgi:hypothetical protein